MRCSVLSSHAKRPDGLQRCRNRGLPRQSRRTFTLKSVRAASPLTAWTDFSSAAIARRLREICQTLASFRLGVRNALDRFRESYQLSDDFAEDLLALPSLRRCLGRSCHVCSPIRSPRRGHIPIQRLKLGEIPERWSLRVFVFLQVEALLKSWDRLSERVDRRTFGELLLDSAILPPHRHGDDHLEQLPKGQLCGDEGLEDRRLCAESLPSGSSLLLSFRTALAIVAATAPAGNFFSGVIRRSHCLRGLAAYLIQTSPKIGESCNCLRSPVGPRRIKSTSSRDDFGTALFYQVVIREESI